MSAPEWERPRELAPLKVTTVFEAEGHKGEFASYPDEDPESPTSAIAAARCSCGWSELVEGGIDAGAIALAALEEHYEAEVETLASPMEKGEDDG